MIIRVLKMELNVAITPMRIASARTTKLVFWLGILLLLRKISMVMRVVRSEAMNVMSGTA
jgi:hypothetical protein